MTFQNSDLKTSVEMWIVCYENYLLNLNAKSSESEISNYLKQQLEVSKKIIQAERPI